MMSRVWMLHGLLIRSTIQGQRLPLQVACRWHMPPAT